MSLGEIIGEDLAQIYANFSKETYQLRCPTVSKPAIEFTCKDEKTARVCETILDNAIRFSSRGQCQYRVWSEMNKIYLLSYRKEDAIGGKINKEYLCELSEKIVHYLSNISFNWGINKSETSIHLKEQLKDSKEINLTVFEHDNVGFEMANLFARLLQIQNCSSSRFDDKSVKGKLLVLCPEAHMINVTEAIKDINFKFTSS